MKNAQYEAAKRFPGNVRSLPLLIAKTVYAEILLEVENVTELLNQAIERDRNI
jgi:hypothetical protein